MPSMEYNHSVQAWTKQCSTPACKRMYSINIKDYTVAQQEMKKYFREDNRDKGNYDGLFSKCNECYGHQHRGRIDNGILKEEMLTEQNGLCAICDRQISFDNKTAAIDHDHKTGITRGILCHGCNSILGHLEKEGLLQRALAYLDKYREE